MSSDIDALREIYVRLGGGEPVVERQAEQRGRLADDETVDDRIGATVAALRERHPFRTGLSDADLVALVRAYFAGESDGEIAARLDASRATVARARVNLHCFRPEDTAAPFDLRELRARVAEGEDDATVAAALGVAERSVARYRHVLATMRAARASNDRFRDEFENVLSNADLAEALTASTIADLRRMEEVTD